MESDLICRRIWVNGEYGTIRYVGELAGQTGTWVGVEWDKPRGKHSGEVGGVSYFTCKGENRGTFARLEQLQPQLPQPMTIMEAVQHKYADSTE
jgi:dynactin complex subunit